MIWFWKFAVCSTLGLLLEEGFALATGGPSGRKCLTLLPMCPVYGLGAVLILLLPAWIKRSALLLWIFGGLAATAAEYGVALWYEDVLHVAFWDYSRLPGNLHGRVCLPFSLAWGVLALVLVRRLDPVLTPLLVRIPLPVGGCAAACLLSDLILSTVLLRHTGDRSCLRRPVP